MLKKEKGDIFLDVSSKVYLESLRFLQLLKTCFSEINSVMDLSSKTTTPARYARPKTWE